MSADRAAAAIPAEVRMISGCKDVQTSADVSNVASFQLPDPAGMAGGACTSALLNVLYSEHQAPSKNLSFQEVLLDMREILKKGRFSQIPQLSSSRPLDIHEPFSLAPEGYGGTRRAVVIGINYTGQQGQLSGCHNDAENMMEYLMDVHRYPKENITVLMDDGVHTNPTRRNILKAFANLVAESQAGDACFVHYSGHGGKLKDDDGDEDDRYDETLIPLDYQSAGQIRDDDIFKTLVGAMPKGVTLTCLMDCCHSGTILDLPYVFKGDGGSDQMELQEDFDFDALISIVQQLGNIQSADDLMKVASEIYDVVKKKPWKRFFH